MPVQPKKTNPKSSSSRKKPVRKRKSVKKTSNTSNFKKSIWIVSSVFVMISLVAFGYYLGQQNIGMSVHKEAKISYKNEPKKKPVLLDDLSKLKTKKPNIVEVSVENKTDTLNERELHLAKKVAGKEHLPKQKHVVLAHQKGKPKLVIIIDDVSTVRQLRKIQALHMKITPSIFPPFKHAMHSNALARGLKHYMIHLPMESGSKQFNMQYKTLKTTFSKAQIIARVKELRRLFPAAHYVNNHTGSVFTDNYKAMFILYAALRKEGFMFVDSRTIASTKVPKIVKKFDDTYVARDTFIDNVHNIKTIHKQLRKAVEIAKKKGHAIAIGHPHSVTMEALSSAGSILKDVELVYIDKLMTI